MTCRSQTNTPTHQIRDGPCLWLPEHLSPSHQQLHPFPYYSFLSRSVSCPLTSKIIEGTLNMTNKYISVPEKRNYFIYIFQFLNVFISSWRTKSPHHPNNKFDQLRNVKGPILCLLFYQIQVKNFCNLVSQSSMTRQQEWEKTLKWKVNSALVLHQRLQGSKQSLNHLSQNHRIIKWFGSGETLKTT